MKKSIFLFFAVILCAMSANAQLYLRGGFNDWNNLTADYQFVGNVCNLELPGGTTYEFKIADSSWGTNFGGDHTFTATATKTLTSEGGNMNITTTIPGTYKFEFVQSTKTLTVTYPEVPAPHDITVRAKLPATWTSSTITAWVWTSENASGTPVTAEKDGDYYKITKNAGALYVIFRNGADWNGDKNQTVDLVYTEDVCLQLNQSGTAKATATVIDCGAVSKDITVKAVVPGAWEETITAWVWPTGGEGKEVTPTKDGNWYVVTENCIELNVIFKNGTGWNGNENQTVNIEGVSENICYQISALTKVDGKCSVTEVDCDAVIEPEAKPEPTPTYDYYITGSFNGWNEKDPAHGMTLDGEVYKATVTLAAGENLVKVTNGTWAGAKGYGAMGAEYDEVSQGASDDNIQVDLTEGKEVVVVYNATTEKVTFEGLTEKAPAPTFDYYITGSFNGNNPKKAENGMTLDGTVYKATVTLAAGDNTLKVTDGTWEKTWGANELGAAYEEVSNPNDGYNNIKITLAAEKEITVIFDATAGKITFEDLTPYVAPLTYTVTVPAGTEKCYIAGNMNGWAFQEMEAVTGETNKFTITIVGAKETDEYKYACQADWAYAEVIEGGGNRTNWTALDEVTEWGKPVIVTYQLKGVGGWEQPGIELVQNPGNDKEYMLTCQAISATDAIKVVRLENGEIKDYYGNGTVKDDVTVAVSYDGEANIKLPAGTYNFYFDTNASEKKLWIEAATDCGPATITLTTGDNSTVIAANIDKIVNVKIERSFTANDGYYTLCVPFNMPASVIGKAYSLGTITEHASGEGININLEEESELSAGVPYLVLPKANMSELVVENVTIQSDIASGQNIYSEELNVNIFFEGFYSASGQTNGTTQYYVGNNGYLYNGEVEIRGLCGLFTITDKDGNLIKVRARVVTREEVETGIDNNQLPNTNIQKVLENGQLIIIRNGEKFNVHGQKL